MPVPIVTPLEVSLLTVKVAPHPLTEEVEVALNCKVCPFVIVNVLEFPAALNHVPESILRCRVPEPLVVEVET